MSVLPVNDKERKMLPVFSLITRYFPKALREVTRVAVANNVRYNPDKSPADINWARGKSTDQLGSLFRHIFEAAVDNAVFEELPPEVQAACGPGFERVYVLAEAAWRALAALELQIEEQECKVPVQPLSVADKVNGLLVEAEARLGPLTDAQKEYGSKAATAYLSQEAGTAVPAGTVASVARARVDCLVNFGLSPQRECGCYNCNHERRIAALSK